MLFNRLINLITIALISFFRGISQDSVQKKVDSEPSTRIVNDTLITKCGYKITVGQEINIGTGSTPDGDFKFIRRNSTGFGTMFITTNNNAYNKSEFSLQRSWAGHKAKL